MTTWNMQAATNLERFLVAVGEMVVIKLGYVWIITASAVVVVDGLVRLDGVIKVT